MIPSDPFDNGRPSSSRREASERANNLSEHEISVNSLSSMAGVNLKAFELVKELLLVEGGEGQGAF